MGAWKRMNSSGRGDVQLTIICLTENRKWCEFGFIYAFVFAVKRDKVTNKQT